MKKHVTALASLALATALFVSACGGGNGESAEPESGGAGADTAKTIDVAATDFAFKPANIDITVPGTYTFVVTNDGKAPHALEIEGAGVEEETGTIAPGDSAELTVEITEAGEYEIYCPVEGHRDMGMEGTLAATAS